MSCDFSSCSASCCDLVSEYMLIYEMPWILNGMYMYILQMYLLNVRMNEEVLFSAAVWKLIKNLLNEEQQKRVVFVKKNQIMKYINAGNLPLHMGGQVRNVITRHATSP